jgi:cell division protein FtsX
MKRPIVFSLFREQSAFMTAVMGIMTFLAVMALGISIAIGTGVSRWNRQWDLYATVQVNGKDNANAVEKIIKTNDDKFSETREISNNEMVKLMQPWISGGENVLEKYLPKMYEVKFKTESDMKPIRDQIKSYGRFVTHQDALRPSISAGLKMIGILSVVLAIIIATIGICISFIARNIAILHKRELEILNQIGASDSFVAHQMQIIVAKICMVACSIGFIVAIPIIIAIIGVAHSARVGLMATIGISGAGWLVLCCVPIAIILFAIFITKRTTIKILNQEQ